MRLNNFALLLCIFAATFTFSSDVWGAESNADTKLRMGYAMKTLYDIDMKDAHAAFTMWSKEVGIQTGYNVTLSMFESFEELMKAFRKGEIDFAIVKSMDFFYVNKGEIDNETIVTNVRAGGKGHYYKLIVQKNSPVQQLKDLKGRKITILKSDQIGAAYLDTLLLKNGFTGSDAFFSHVEEKVKASQALLSVFFGQSDACLIPNVSYATIVELNPQVQQKITQIGASDNFLAGVGFFRKNYGDIQKKEVMKTIIGLQNSPRGKQILLLFKSDRFERVEIGEFASVKDLMDDYTRLMKQKTNKVLAQKK
jgi:ABC-type phosphate/phosphonate transport system substrate-binding protein